MTCGFIVLFAIRGSLARLIFSFLLDLLSWGLIILRLPTIPIIWIFYLWNLISNRGWVRVEPWGMHNSHGLMSHICCDGVTRRHYGWKNCREPEGHLLKLRWMIHQEVWRPWGLEGWGRMEHVTHDTSLGRHVEWRGEVRRVKSGRHRWESKLATNHRRCTHPYHTVCCKLILHHLSLILRRHKASPIEPILPRSHWARVKHLWWREPHVWTLVTVDLRYRDHFPMILLL
jgi:hypothetical protein